MKLSTIALLSIVSLVLLLANSACFADSESLLSIRCNQEDSNTKIYLNGQFKGDCSNNFQLNLFLTPGKYQVKAVKAVSKDKEQTFNKTITTVSDSPKRLWINLSQPHLNAAIISSLSLATEPLIIMETSKGVIIIELNDARAPVSCKNFRQYVQDGFFDGLIFHRVIPGFMIQGGGFEPGMTKRKTRKPIFNEADNGLKNRRGTLSMARTASVNSATAQFFLNVNDNRDLDHKSMTQAGYGYAVFGQVVDGMDIADKIVSVPRGQHGMFDDVPKEDVLIIKMYENK